MNFIKKNKNLSIKKTIIRLNNFLTFKTQMSPRKKDSIMNFKMNAKEQ